MPTLHKSVLGHHVDNFLSSGDHSLKVLRWGLCLEDVPCSIENFKNWIEQGRHGSLQYLADHRKVLREKITNYFPDFRSGIVFLIDYRNAEQFLKSEEADVKIARYVMGIGGYDYHKVIGQFFNQLANHLAKHIPHFKWANSIDMHPVLERDMAYRAGLGWFGKNSMLISPLYGSYFLIAGLLSNIEIDTSTTSCGEEYADISSKKQGLFQSNLEFFEADHCGTCRACVDACPTAAIDPNTRTLNANKCISTYTIELFKPAPSPQGMENSDGWIFGCDICQEVCPWNQATFRRLENKHTIGGAKGEFTTLPLTPLQQQLKDFFLNRPLSQIVQELKGMSNRGFEKKFFDTPLARTGRVGLLKNLQVYLK